MQNYRMKCRNNKCGAEFHRRYSNDEFDDLQYSSKGGHKGIGCFGCGYPKMMVMRSKKLVKDGFQPGFQRNIMKHCSTYSEYKAQLRQMGLIELGYEDLPKAKENRIQYWDDEFLKKVYNEHGVKFSDNEAEHMKTLKDQAV